MRAVWGVVDRRCVLLLVGVFGVGGMPNVSSTSSNITHVSKQIRQHFPLYFEPEQRPNGSTPRWVQVSESQDAIAVMILQIS
jgi:hypothetical protein